jgi:SNF2 family DNA or RNA helicase
VKETFGSWDSYCREFDSVLKDHKRIWRDPSPRALALLSRVIIRHDKKILNLPPRIYQDIDLELTKDAAAICKHLEDTLKRLNVDLEQALDSLDSMGDKDKDSIITAFKHLASLKIPSMLGVLESYEDSKTPVIVASVHRAPIEILKDRPGWKVIYGDMSESEREASWRAFQAGEVVGLGVTIQTAGEGLTLTQGAHMIFVDRHWNPQKNLQCEGRIYRIGQSKTSNYIDLRWDHPLESRKYEILNKKKALIERTIDSIPSISAPNLENKVTWEEWCMSEAEKIDSPDIQAAVEYYRTWGRLKREWWNLVESRVMNMHKDASLELPNG